MKSFTPTELVADGLATVDEAEHFLSIGRSKLYSLMDAGQLPFCKIGRSRRIPWQAVRQLAQDALIRGNEVEKSDDNQATASTGGDK